VAQTGIQFGENIYFNVWFNVIISVGGLKKGRVRSWEVQLGTSRYLTKGWRKGASDSITVGSSATHVKLCIRTSLTEKKEHNESDPCLSLIQKYQWMFHKACRTVCCIKRKKWVKYVQLKRQGYLMYADIYMWFSILVLNSSVYHCTQFIEPTKRRVLNK